jgi:hypothetical protein
MKTNSLEYVPYSKLLEKFISEKKFNLYNKKLTNEEKDMYKHEIEHLYIQLQKVKKYERDRIK